MSLCGRRQGTPCSYGEGCVLSWWKQGKGRVLIEWGGREAVERASVPRVRRERSLVGPRAEVFSLALES